MVLGMVNEWQELPSAENRRTPLIYDSTQKEIQQGIKNWAHSKFEGRKGKFKLLGNAFTTNLKNINLE